jgi:hypothetical protein
MSLTTEQRLELIDRAETALVAQGKPSFDPQGDGGLGVCRYRGPGGTKCALGHLITDEAYGGVKGLETRGPYSEDVQNALRESGIPCTSDDARFLSALQNRCHDGIHNAEAFADSVKNACKALREDVRLGMFG